MLVWVTPALWSSNYVIARAASGVVSPHTLALGRWLLAFVLMLPLVWRDIHPMFGVWREEWRQMVLLGALGMWVCGAFVYIGAQSTTATNIGLIYAATPVGIALAGKIMMHEATSRLQRVGMALAFIGVVYVIARGNPLTLLEVRITRGDVWIVLASVSWVAYSVLQQYWPSRLGARQRLACITVGGLIVLLPFTLLEHQLIAVPSLSAKGLLLIGLAGTLPGFLSYQAYAIMVRELGATKAGVVMYLSPLYAALAAWWFLGETPHWYHAVGATLILPSIYLATTATHGQSRSRA